MREMMLESLDEIEQKTRRWLENIVIGLNLCPFAKSVYIKNQVRIVIYQGDEEGLLAKLAQELSYLEETSEEIVDTSLVITPWLFAAYEDFNDFLSKTDRLIQRLGLDGAIQIADFHPHYQFAGTKKEDMENYTNRAPYPIFHLLREESIDKAVEQFPDPARIFEKNIEMMKTLTPQSYQALSQSLGQLTEVIQKKSS